MVILMGSLTVRNIGEDVKQRLRMRAAASGRSMEEEVRLLLANGAAEAVTPPSRAPASATPVRPETAARRVLLVISGGIAAYKSRPDPPPAQRGFALRGDDQGGAGVRDTALGRRDRWRACLHGLFDPSSNSTSATSGWRATPTSSWSRPRPPT
jgi:plasmid stability protein